jgi:hypothetical protein
MKGAGVMATGNKTIELSMQKRLEETTRTLMRNRCRTPKTAFLMEQDLKPVIGAAICYGIALGKSFAEEESPRCEGTYEQER